MDCIFCKIAAGEIPSSTLYEDDTVRAILDINPATYGHALVMPKKHCANLMECDDQTLEAVYKTARELAKKMKEVLKCDGVNFLSNAGEAAGQSVDHFHVHVIPRYKDDEQKDTLILKNGTVENVDFGKLKELISL